MNKNTSISLRNYFDQFVKSRITEGRFKNVSKVIRAGLRLLEEEESKIIALKNAIREGIADSLNLGKNIVELLKTYLELKRIDILFPTELLQKTTLKSREFCTREWI